jgi:hypothetical protein
MGMYNNKTRLVKDIILVYNWDLFSHLLFAVSYLSSGRQLRIILNYLIGLTRKLGIG